MPQVKEERGRNQQVCRRLPPTLGSADCELVAPISGSQPHLDFCLISHRPCPPLASALQPPIPAVPGFLYRRSLPSLGKKILGLLSSLSLFLWQKGSYTARTSIGISSALPWERRKKNRHSCTTCTFSRQLNQRFLRAFPPVNIDVKSFVHKRTQYAILSRIHAISLSTARYILAI